MVLPQKFHDHMCLLLAASEDTLLLPPFSPSPEKLWIGKCVESEKWQELIHKFFSTGPSEVLIETQELMHLFECKCK